jgi:hypothetical protein
MDHGNVNHTLMSSHSGAYHASSFADILVASLYLFLRGLCHHTLGRLCSVRTPGQVAD